MSSQLRVDKILPVDGAPTGGGGGIIQVVGTMNTTQVTTTNTQLNNPTDSGMSVTLTPKFATSKILIMINASLRGDGTAYVNAMIKRNGTLIDYSDCSDDGILDYAINTAPGNSSWNFFDSPNSTSALTYGFFFSRYGGSGTAYFNNNGNHYSCSTMTAMEISA
jgi:hypothetical protein